MRMHWMGVNTAEANVTLKTQRTRCPGSETNEEEASQGRERTEGPGADFSPKREPAEP